MRSRNYSYVIPVSFREERKEQEHRPLSALLIFHVTPKHRDKEDYIMVSFLPNAGYAIASLDFTSELSTVLIGLCLLIAFSVVVLVKEAIRDHTMPQTDVQPNALPAAAGDKMAA